MTTSDPSNNDSGPLRPSTYCLIVLGVVLTIFMVLTAWFVQHRRHKRLAQGMMADHQSRNDKRYQNGAVVGAVTNV